MSYTSQTPDNREEFGDVELYHVKHNSVQLALDTVALIPELLADDWKSSSVRVYAGTMYSDGDYTSSVRMSKRKERWGSEDHYAIRVEIAVPEYMADDKLKKLFADVVTSEEADDAEARRIQREKNLAEADELEAKAAKLREQAEALRK